MFRLGEEHSGGHCEVQDTVKTKQVTYIDLVYSSTYKKKASRQTTSNATYLEKEVKNMVFLGVMYTSRSHLKLVTNLEWGLLMLTMDLSCECIKDE